MHSREIPVPQYMFSNYGMHDAPVYESLIQRAFSKFIDTFDRVEIVTDLYCGNGVLTLGSILAFPNAQIHAVDYHDVLVPDALNHPRVIFHKGFVTDVISAGLIPPSDVVFMSLPNKTHGFGESSIYLLRTVVRKYIYTMSDSFIDFDSTHWFTNNFVCIASKRPGDYKIWQPR